jgi:hypothetical protein
MRGRLKDTCVIICVMVILCALDVTVAASGKVLFETDFSTEDWSIWETEDAVWGVEPSLGDFWVIRDGVFTQDPDSEYASSAEFIFLNLGYDWTNYRMQLEMEIVEGCALGTWIFRADSADDLYIYQMTAADSPWSPNGLRPHKKLWGEWHVERLDDNYPKIAEEIVAGKIYNVVVEVVDTNIKVYINGDLVDDWTDPDDSLLTGTIGFRNPVPEYETFKCHSIKITEL